MATYATIHPNATGTNSPVAAVFPSGTVHAAIDDRNNGGAADNSNYIYPSNGVEYTVIVRLTTYTMPANVKCGAVRAVCSIRGEVNGDDLGTEVYLRYSATDVLNINDYRNNQTAWKTLIGGWQETKPTGGAWDQAAIDGLELKLHQDSILDLAEMSWAYAELQLHTQPEVDITSPTWDSVTDDAFRVLFNVQAAGDAAYRYQLKVWTKAVYETGGFDPETSATVYDSGVLSHGGVSGHDIPEGILTLGSEYYVGVKASTLPTTTIGEWWSASWTSVRFRVTSQATVNVTAPSGTIISSQPTVTFTYSDADNKPLVGSTLRVYANPGSWAGFDPDTTLETPLYEVLLGNELSHQIATALPNNTNMRVYVRPITGGFLTLGAWDFSEFTTDYPEPAPPTLTITTDPAGARVLLSALGHSNLLTANQSSLETDTTGWEVDSNVTIARTTAQAYHGTASLQMTRGGAAAAMLARTPTGLSGRQVAASAQHTARARFRAATTGRSCRVLIRWYDNIGALISTSTGGSITDTTGGWTEATVTATSPSNAARAAVVVEIQGTPGAAEVHYVDAIALAPGSGADTPWSLGGLLGVNDKMTIQRQDVDDPTVYHTVRTADAVDIGSELSQWVLAYDNEAPFNKPLTYRAFVTSVYQSLPVTSDYGTASEPAGLVVKRAWLKSVDNPSLNMHLVLQDRWLQRNNRKRRSSYEPMDRLKPVVFKAPSQYERFTVTALVMGEEDYDKLTEILDGDGTMLFQTARKDWYVELDGDYNISQSLWDELHGREVTHVFLIPFVEVERP